MKPWSYGGRPSHFLFYQISFILYKKQWDFFNFILFSITELSGKVTPLLRIRNPHGNSTEWNGPWSDSRMHMYDAKQLDMQAKPDGEFWMCLDDFSENFHAVEICHLPFEKDFCKSFHGKWVGIAIHEWLVGVSKMLTLLWKEISTWENLFKTHLLLFETCPTT